MEKRSNKRHNCKALMTCSYFNKNEPFGFKMLNFSEDGAYLEGNSLLKERSIVLLRLERFLSGASDIEGYCGPRNMSLGEVRWCNEMGDKNFPRYSIGVKYY